jgi:hypothetical protein
LVNPGEDAMKASRLAVAIGALFATATLASGRITIVSEQDAAQSWSPTPETARFVAGYPKSAAGSGQDVCINLGYLIDNEGKTSNFVEMKSWSSKGGEQKGTPELEPFVQLAAATVSLRRYTPVGKVRQIYTSTSFVFPGSNTLGEEEIRAQCRIDDLPAFVAAADQANKDRRHMVEETKRDRMRSMGSSGY